MNSSTIVLVVAGVLMLFFLVQWGVRTLRAKELQQPTPPAADPAGLQEPFIPPILNFLKVDDRVCTSGQPTEAALRKLAGEGIKSVLNLRTVGENVDPIAEGKWVESLGLKYFHIPVDAKDLRDSQVEEFIRIVSNPENAPMLVHCASANRVGAFWMIYRAVHDGWPVEKAEAEATRVGLSSLLLRQFAVDYLSRHTAIPARETTIRAKP